jgi:erythronate-4-phosphate dehydrogenase
MSLPHPLCIVCDANMPLAAETFGALGEVRLLDGRDIRAADVREADLLFTRSTTRVNRDLLTGSRVRFYGSAVIGTDHIDAAWLAAAGIPWCAAPGCNAASVSDYVASALLGLAGRHGFRLRGKTLGVIGVGQVGRRVCAKGQALGLRVLACDPPRQRDPADAAARDFVPLTALLEAADIVTCHVPLTREGIDRTVHLLDAPSLARLRPGALLINAARGEVLDSKALLPLLGGRVAHAVIDTWEGEPRYRPDLLAAVDLATPHIAGHSYEGKANGTRLVYEAACRFLGVAPRAAPALPPPPVPHLALDAAGRDPEEVLRELALAVYDVASDDRALRASCVADDTARARAFDRLRRDYPLRREFTATTVTLAHADDALRRQVRDLGFQLEPPAAAGAGAA